MPSDVGQSEPSLDPLSVRAPVGGLPPRLRLLCIASEEPSWINLTLQLDAEGCLEPQFRWVSTAASALAVLRDESFDCLIIGETGADATSAERHRESVELLRAVRASGCDDPAILIAPTLSDKVWLQLLDVECTVLTSPRLWESRALVPVMKREIARVELIRENHQLTVAQHRRLFRERDEAEHLLDQQRRMIQDLGGLIALAPSTDDDATPNVSAGAAATASSNVVLPPEINYFYTELLRTYVIMGSGSLGTEIAQLAEVIALAGLSPRGTLELHVERVQSLVRGLGNRSSRHVMARADLLALELMIHLAECYRRECRTSQKADRQDTANNVAAA